jgi:hypothetical protein
MLVPGGLKQQPLIWVITLGQGRAKCINRFVYLVRHSPVEILYTLMVFAPRKSRWRRQMKPMFSHANGMVGGLYSFA